LQHHHHVSFEKRLLLLNWLETFICTGPGVLFHLLYVVLLLLLLPGMLYCMEYLAANLDWLKEKLQPLEDSECTNPLLLLLPMLLSLILQMAAE
jgi:hypothetical protein